MQNVDGGGREFLVYGGSPRWNADGSKIAYTDWRTLKCLDVSSGEEESLLDVQLDERPFHFDWSRDGRRLGFVAQQQGAPRASCTSSTRPSCNTRSRHVGPAPVASRASSPGVPTVSNWRSISTTTSTSSTSRETRRRDGFPVKPCRATSRTGHRTASGWPLPAGLFPKADISVIYSSQGSRSPRSNMDVDRRMAFGHPQYRPLADWSRGNRKPLMRRRRNLGTSVQVGSFPDLGSRRTSRMLSLEDQIVVALRRISQAIDVWSRCLWQDYGLTSPQLATLRQDHGRQQRHAGHPGGGSASEPADRHRHSGPAGTPRPHSPRALAV